MTDDDMMKKCGRRQPSWFCDECTVHRILSSSVVRSQQTHSRALQHLRHRGRPLQMVCLIKVDLSSPVCPTLAMEDVGRSSNSEGSDVRRMHTSLGHATVPDKRRMLLAATAPQAVTDALSRFSCSQWDAMTAPKIPRVVLWRFHKPSPLWDVWSRTSNGCSAWKKMFGTSQPTMSTRPTIYSTSAILRDGDIRGTLETDG